MSKMVYLDYAATTPVDKRVIEAMLPFFDASFGNPSSVHRFGQVAEAAVESSRETIASVLNCQPDEIIFTSCGSESDNLALRGVLQQVRSGIQPRLLTSRAEHHAVSKTAEQLQKIKDVLVEWLPIDAQGLVTPEVMREASEQGAVLASIMMANNEIGTINPVKELASICKTSGILFHTDAVQAAAYLDVDVHMLGIDMLSLGAHKFYGPKGIGALFVRKGTELLPHLTGGGQEFGLRAGTQNVPYIFGFAEALRLAKVERSDRIAHVKPLRDSLIGRVLEAIPETQLSGHPINRLPNHASFVFKDVDGNLLLQLLDAAGFACSSGSACKTGNPEPSEVITSLGYSRDWALGSLRVTLGRDTSPEQIDAFIGTLPGLVDKARKLK